MKKTITYILAALIAVCMPSSCYKEIKPLDNLAGEWLVELQGDAFDSIVADLDLDIPEGADGLTIIYNFDGKGSGWKEMVITEDSYLVFVPYDRYHTLFRYSISDAGKVDITILNEDGKDSEEGDELFFDGNSLTDTFFTDQPLRFARATEDQIKWYQDEADAWYGGSDTPGNGISGVSEGWNWAAAIPATANDR